MSQRERPGVMTARQAYALAHPLNQAEGDIRPYVASRRHATGLILQSVLAVDR
jgi:hypothetical protein